MLRNAVITVLHVAAFSLPSQPGALHGQQSPGAFLAEQLGRRCAASVARPTTMPNLVIDAAGGVLRGLNRVPSERDSIAVFVVAETTALDRLVLHQTSPSRNPDAVRWIGMSVSGPESTDPEPCAYKEYRVHGPAAPEAALELKLLGDELPPAKIADVRFPVRRLYRGALSFGPFWSEKPLRTYQSVPTLGGSEPTDSTLVETVGSRGVIYALTLTYFFRRPAPRDSGLRVGAFLGIPIEAFGDNALGGLSFDFGGGVFLVHVGAHAGKETVLLNPGLRNGDATNGLAIETESKWDVDWVFGFTIDAEAASSAFGKVIDSLGGT